LPELAIGDGFACIRAAAEHWPRQMDTVSYVRIHHARHYGLVVALSLDEALARKLFKRWPFQLEHDTREEVRQGRHGQWVRIVEHAKKNFPGRKKCNVENQRS
jgi:hypothetical protein